MIQWCADARMNGAPTRAAAASGAGIAASSGSPISQKLGRSNDKDNRYCFADAVLLTLRLDVPPRRRGIAHSTSQPGPYQAKTLTLEAASIKKKHTCTYNKKCNHLPQIESYLSSTITRKYVLLS